MSLFVQQFRLLHINNVLIISSIWILSCFSTELSAQQKKHSELGLQLKSTIPSAFSVFPEYDIEIFPYFSTFQRNGRSFGIQLSYSVDLSEHWGINAYIGGSLYSTGLGLYLPEDEDPDPNPNGYGVYDFYDGLDAGRISTAVGFHYIVKCKWFDIKPSIGINLSSHFEESLTLRQGYSVENPSGPWTFVPVFQVYIERKHFVEVNPMGGVYLSINSFSKLLNVILGFQYVFDSSESLAGIYQIDAVSGQYIGTLSNTEERLEFIVGVSFNLNKIKAGKD